MGNGSDKQEQTSNAPSGQTWTGVFALGEITIGEAFLRS
jgi:hypothetical protein